MKENEIHIESQIPSTDYFEELRTAIGLVPDYAKIYRTFNRIFRFFLDEKTSSTNLNLVGPFAKLDYLIKEKHAPKYLSVSINDTRVRLRNYSESSDEELKESYLLDLRNLCQFISFIEEEEIPESLLEVFPSIIRDIKKTSAVCDCIRMIIDHWDDEYVYGSSDNSSDGELIKVCYAHSNKYYNFDWSYLKDLFRERAQVNLVLPRLEEEVYYPELIIFEPDYLVDITTISHCFTGYADSPLVNLISKLQPSKNSEAIVLGNLAGQLLDEAIHNLPDTHTYADSVKDFFKSQAFSLLTAELSSSFHTEAQKQKQNISVAINNTLPNSISCYDAREGIVEPSFFSEMLGMQGRMDYLQSDFKVLLEQKSGKGEFPFGNFVIPRQKEEHYVQLLMYMILIRYNFRNIYEQNNRELHSFLLYTKYSSSLLGLSFSAELIFKAIKLRNELAYNELRCATSNGYNILVTLSPDDLNEKKLNNTFWHEYIRPQLAQILDPIKLATEIEREYYIRFLTFVANEHVLSKLGNQTVENSGFAAKWYDTLDEKLLSGNIYCNLRLYYPDNETEGNIRTVKLYFSEDKNNDMSNFRVGDIVILYSYEKGEEPDARKNMVFRASIKDITSTTISLRLRAVQTDAKLFLKDEDKLWAIEHDFIESSYSSLYRGIHSFLSAPLSRRNLLMLQREPDIDRTLSLKGDYGLFNELALKVKQARDFFLIIGPPGTGKTSFGLMTTVKEELLESGSTVLLLSYTNRAVDEICSKLKKENIDYIRIGNELSCAPEYRDNLLSSKTQDCSNINQIRELIVSARVFVGTTTSLNSNIALFNLKQFSLAIIDEASQILEPHLLGLLSANNSGIPAIKKFVMIGDHKQLPAVVQQNPYSSKVDSDLLKSIELTDCRMSLFERLLRRYSDREDVTYMLIRQGRMHHDIAHFPNIAFYNGKLQEVPLDHQNKVLPSNCQDKNGITNILSTRRIAFLAADSPEDSSSEKVNQIEADIIAATVVKIYEKEFEHFDVNETVGVIVPYRNQIAAVRNTIDRYGIDALHDITIDTVERYQGSERDYIVYGFTLQKFYQLKFLTNNVFEDFDGTIVDRKLNVAMTRAREHLIMVGNPSLLSFNPIFKRLIDYVKDQHSYFYIDKDEYVKGTFYIEDSLS